MKKLQFVATAMAVCLFPLQAYAAADSRDGQKQVNFSPFVGQSHPSQLLFGDTHLHTNLSPDAGLVGTTLSVEDAYRFAAGEELESNTGQRVRLVRPLDFLVVTDHAEYMGLAPMIRESDPVLLADEYGRWLYDNFRAGPEGRGKAFKSIVADAVAGNNRLAESEMAESIWQGFTKTSDQYNRPGQFTAFIGFEWSAMPNGNNLHRVVVFRDGADKAAQVLPFGTFDSSNPEDLWDYLADYEDKTGGDVLAIPHNGNLSNGVMFSNKQSTGEEMDRDHAQKRIRWEPIIEATQMKGDGETHPRFSTEDEFADFENWDVANIDGSTPKEDWMFQYEYARPALQVGLKLGEALGVNPYKFGLSAATDSHTALATSREENYFGKLAKSEPSTKRQKNVVIPAQDPELNIFTSQEVASGLTAVWATENTRGAIFDAMRRKEVYATTGNRLKVRMFGGWDFEKADATKPDYVVQGYSRGVPMGGDLTSAPAGRSPRLLVSAQRDADGANLDRVQVIKGWLDNKGELQERIYDVAVSDSREIGDDGRAREAVGNTVNVEKATYTNTIGASSLSAHWEDPDFDAGQPAFYYVRVLEIPTPRWTTYDAARLGVTLPENVPATIQDRAYTSPIWYTP